MKTPILETDRILLRTMKSSDAKAVFNNWATDIDVVKYLRWNIHQSINTTIDWLTYEEGNVESDYSYQWVFVHKEYNEVFGSGGFSYDEERQMFELGYAIMKRYWNQGLATEAVKVMVDFAVNTLNQTGIFAISSKENPASAKVLEKAGFIYCKDGEYSSFDGKRVFHSKEYLFDTNARV